MNRVDGQAQMSPAEPHYGPDVFAAQPEASPYLSRSCISVAVSGCAPFGLPA
jgi:hypothetical protein